MAKNEWWQIETFGPGGRRPANSGNIPWWMRPLPPRKLGWQNVEIPNVAFNWLPFIVQKNENNFRVSGWTIDGAKPVGKSYYVSTTGNDSNDGSAIDDAHAFRSIHKATHDQADVDVVYVKAGLYGKTYSNIQSSRSISIIASGGRVIAGQWFEGLSWSADGNAYTAALVSVNTYRAVDASFVDANGDYAILTLAANSDAVKTTPGSWYCDGTSVWVRTSDDRIPDINIRIFDSSTFTASLGLAGGNGTFYVEGFDFEGGYHSFYANAQTKTGQVIYMNNCSFKYSSRSGFSNAGFTAYLKDCLSAKNAQDAFTPTASGSAIPRQVEINCVGRDSIGANEANNASTGHSGVSIVSIMGNYYYTAGPIVHIINNGSTAWYLGCKAYHSFATSWANQVAFQIGTQPTGDTALMWLDTCTGYGDTEGTKSRGGDVRANAGNILYYRNFTGSLINDGSGTIAPY